MRDSITEYKAIVRFSKVVKSLGRLAFGDRSGTKKVSKLPVLLVEL